MTITLQRTVRGVSVTIYAEDFFEDRSVGIHLGPEVLYAKTVEGEDFPLTEEEEMHYAGEATDVLLREE